ncbi:hypothetical protein ACWCSH_44660 [Streptosporangium sp. NPDC001682]
MFPSVFGSFAGARSFCRRFFGCCSREQYHSGIGLHTPFSVHIGTAQAIQERRGATIEVFRMANPQRFTRKPSLPTLPDVAWVNRPDSDQGQQPKEAAA